VHTVTGIGDDTALDDGRSIGIGKEGIGRARVEVAAIALECLVLRMNSPRFTARYIAT
jgi:hypothetical protein